MLKLLYIFAAEVVNLKPLCEYKIILGTDVLSSN